MIFLATVSRCISRYSNKAENSFIQNGYRCRSHGNQQSNISTVGKTGVEESVQNFVWSSPPPNTKSTWAVFWMAQIQSTVNTPDTEDTDFAKKQEVSHFTAIVANHTRCRAYLARAMLVTTTTHHSAYTAPLALVLTSGFEVCPTLSVHSNLGFDGGVGLLPAEWWSLPTVASLMFV